MSGDAGYSGTPLVRKLGLEEGMTVRLEGAPRGYWDLLGGSPSTLRLTEVEGTTSPVDFVHLFASRRDSLAARFRIARDVMAEDGMVWASWPKKSSGVESEVHRSDVMAAGKAEGLVDVKVCAVDETWSGLKFVIPVDERS